MIGYFYASGSRTMLALYYCFICLEAVAFPTCCYYPRSDTGAGNTTLYNLHCSGSPSRLINCSYNLAQVRR